VGQGRPHEVIVGDAASLQADLLVLGTHGHSGFHRLLLGSVTEKAVRTAPCPVLTVPPALAGASPHVVFRQILCPTDFSPTSQRATQLALDLGRQAGGCVTLLHAVEYLEPEEPCEHVAFDIRDYRARLLEHFRQRLHAQVADDARTWCEVQEVLAINRAYREILDRAAALPADLIVMGAQGHGGLELMLYGSNTQQVVRRATCPVLTVRA
jgi:nucleotide-binding universal stress UspA family protein